MCTRDLKTGNAQALFWQPLLEDGYGRRSQGIKEEPWHPEGVAMQRNRAGGSLGAAKGHGMLSLAFLIAQ